MLSYGIPLVKEEGRKDLLFEIVYMNLQGNRLSEDGHFKKGIKTLCCCRIPLFQFYLFITLVISIIYFY